MQVLSFLQRYRVPSWLPVGGALLVLCGYSTALGYLIATDRLMIAALLMMAPAGLSVIAFASNYFRFLVLALPVTALVLPIAELPTGTESKLPLSMLIALLLMVVWVVSMLIRGWKLAPSPINRPLLIFAAVCIISLPWGILWRDPGLIDAPKFIITQIGALITILLSMMAGLLIGNFVTTTRHLKFIVAVFLIFCTLMTITQLLRISQSLLNDRGLWGMWLVAPAYGLLIAQPGLRWYWRGLLVIILVLNLYQTMIVNSFWVSGWMPSIIALLAVTLFHSRKLFLVVLIIAALGGLGMRAFFLDVANENIEDGSLERLAIWQQNWRVVSAHWLFGTGPAGYAIYYMTYFREDARSTHNNYLDILAQFGFIGMLVWLWFVGVSIWEGWQLVQRAPPGFVRTVAIIATGGWVGAMAAMFFGDWVLPFAYNQGIAGYKYTVYSWIFLGTLISIRQILDQRSEEGTAEEVEA